MDKRRAVFRQSIDGSVFDGDELQKVPNVATLTGGGVKVASARGWPLAARGGCRPAPAGLGSNRVCLDLPGGPNKQKDPHKAGPFVCVASPRGFEPLLPP